MITIRIKLILGIIALACSSFTLQAQSYKPVNPENLNRLVATKIALDKEGAFDDRYTIQIFQGENQNALATKSKYDALHLQWKSELRYSSPDFKIWIGKYRSKLEADRALLEIQKNFPNAKVLKP